MATKTSTRTPLDQTTHSENELRCGICHKLYKQPKLLDCLHSFCERCLEGRYRSVEKIPCPLCQQETQLPEKGIQGLQTNFHLISKAGISSLQEKVANARSSNMKMNCEICDEGNEATHCCLECAQIICSKCEVLHQRFSTTENHQMTTLEDIMNEKTGAKKLLEEDGSRCYKHNSNLKQFYCETCEELICQDCITREHCKPEHDYTDFGNAYVKRKQLLQDLFRDVIRHTQELGESLANTSHAEQEFVEQMASITEAVHQCQTKVKEKVTTQTNNLVNHIKMTEKRQVKIFDQHKKTVTVMLQKAEHSLNTATNIRNNATQNDFLALYPTISKNLQLLESQKPPELKIDHGDSHLKFKQILHIGDINLGILQPEVKWEMCHDFKSYGDTGLILGPPKFSSIYGITALQPNEIAVTDRGSSVALKWQDRTGRVLILSTEGQLRRKIQMQTDSRGIATAHNQLLVTDCTHCVKMYDKDNELSFGAFSTSKNWLDYFYVMVLQGSSLATPVKPVSVAVKNDGAIVVGDVQRNVLTVHNPNNGSLKCTIRLKMAPEFLAIDSKDRFVVSDVEKAEVAIVDDSGTALITIKPTIKGDRVKQCKGVCCHRSGVYVAVNNEAYNTGHIHYYDTECGEFLGCIAQGLYQPQGITFTADGQWLAVADTNSLKMYHKV